MKEKLSLIGTRLAIFLLVLCYCCVRPDFSRAREIAASAHGSNSVNIALGKPYTLDPKPNYERSSDKGDLTQLTDGTIYDGNGQLWLQKETVGWVHKYRVKITVDLGELRSIGGIGIHAGFDGPMNVQWPSSIAVFVSDNDKNYEFLTELVNPAWQNEGLPDELNPLDHCAKEKNISWWYRDGGLRARARYVVFMATTPLYFFCDEIEITEGGDKEQVQPSGKIAKEDLGAYVAVRLCFEGSINGIRRNAASLPEETRKILETEISGVEAKLAGMDWEALFRSPGYRAMAPLNDLHRELFRINAEALRMRGAPPLVVWHKHRWDPLEAIEVPKNMMTQTGWKRMLSRLGLFEKLPELKLELMNGEYRAETLNLTNVKPEDQEVNIFFENLPGGKTPSYIRVHQVEFVVTKDKMIADALPEAEKDVNGYKIRIPSGMTRQVWFGIHPDGITAGAYNGRIVIIPKGCLRRRRVEFNLAIAPFKFSERPKLSFYLWDYTDQPYGFAGMTDANVKLAIDDMKAHFVDTPFAHAGSACYPDKDAFDAEGKLVGKLKTEGFDDWVSRWKEARYYGLYLGNNPPDFVANETPGSERFNRKIAQWSAAFAEYAEKKGIPPERIMLHLYDEPSFTEHYRLNTLWAKAIKQGCSRFRLFVNSACDKPVLELVEMLEQYNVISPMFPLCGISETLKMESIKPTKELHLNNSHGDTTRLLDPYYYHLLLAWHCWKNGATGMSTWNYWNYPLSAWNEVMLEPPSYGLVYTTENSVTSGKHWEALREGIEDYEYLAMLKNKMEQAKKNGKNQAIIVEAETFLHNAPKQVAGSYDRVKRLWRVEKDRTAADAARHQVLRLLQKMEDAE